MNKRNIIFFILFVFIFGFTNTYSYAIKENLADSESVLQEEKVYVNKISFEDVLKKAKAHSYDLKIADFNILIAKQGIRNARSEYFPKLNAGIGTEYTKNFRDVKETTIMSIGDAFINPYTRYQSVMGINVMYNLFDFGIRGGNLKIAKEETALKEWESLAKLQEMNLTLLDNYTKILITSKQVEKNKQILDLEEKNLEMKERLFKAKEISKTDLNDAKVKVKTTKSKISELLSIEQESLNWLSFYTGDNYDIEKLEIEDLKKSEFDVLAFQDYTKSLTWKVYEKYIKKKELELKVVKKTNYPKLNVYGRYYLYGSDKSNYGKSLGDIGPSNFTVGASLSIPIFDGMKNSSNIQKTILELKQLHVERDKAIAQLMTRLANLRSNLMYLDDQIKEGNGILEELTDKEKSLRKLASKRLISPIEENEAKVELLNQLIESDKNSITRNAIMEGISILTEEY